LALTACARYPQIQGVVFDHPGAISTTREHVGQGATGGRTALLAGDFFTDSLPEADIFTLGRILHDGSDEKVQTLLKNLREK
jgi:acetylserotonin N-methyltransferase